AKMRQMVTQGRRIELEITGRPACHGVETVGELDIFISPAGEVLVETAAGAEVGSGQRHVVRVPEDPWHVAGRECRRVKAVAEPEVPDMPAGQIGWRSRLAVHQPPAPLVPSAEQHLVRE